MLAHATHLQSHPENRPLRLLHVVAGAERGGAETFCLDAILALHEAGIEQYVICRPHGPFTERLRTCGVAFETMGFGAFGRLGPGKMRIRRAARRFKADVIHAWMGRAASFMPHNSPAPVLGWFGGYYDLKRYKNCDYYMGVTHDIVRHIIDKTGRPERTFLVHTFGTLPPDAPVKRTALNTPEDAPVVLMLSRMHWKKGVDTLLQAAALLPGVYFWLAGDGPEKGKYETMAREMGLTERVRFLGWRTDRSALLQGATVCALPSRYEPFGTVIAEAWHARVPLVATRADGARQYVKHGETGLLCEIDNAEDLARQISAVTADQTLRQNMTEKAFAFYEQTFSKAAVIQALISAYGSMRSAI
jgi:glycosyltransferase involved in cell wall biosynthesis